jgi:hypothetical protein
MKVEILIYYRGIPLSPFFSYLHLNKSQIYILTTEDTELLNLLDLQNFIVNSLKNGILIIFGDFKPLILRPLEHKSAQRCFWDWI